MGEPPSPAVPTGIHEGSEYSAVVGGAGSFESCRRGAVVVLLGCRLCWCGVVTVSCSCWVEVNIFYLEGQPDHAWRSRGPSVRACTGHVREVPSSARVRRAPVPSAVRRHGLRARYWWAVH